jgi:hypothetical protein
MRIPLSRSPGLGSLSVALTNRAASGTALMASVTVRVPGQAGVVEAKAAQLAAAVQWHWNAASGPVTALPQAMPRRPSAGDLGRPLQTARLT